jgi:microcystin-dependent protein
MGEPMVGEIRMFAGSFAPSGWLICNGALLPISENETLFQLIGTTYGGDGQSTFAIPNLQSRVPVHAGNGFTLAEAAGTESVTLTVNQIPAHNHVPLCNTTAGTVPNPGGAVWSAAGTGEQCYNDPPNPPGGNIRTDGIGPTGGSQPHDNMAPYLCINFIISLYGVYPNPN